jgi:Leucine-rich repeat (LRR) protein
VDSRRLLSGSLNGPALGVLTGLQELDLNGHSLTTIPKQIGNLSALTLLDLGADVCANADCS